jgi:hypothetical protein
VLAKHILIALMASPAPAPGSLNAVTRVKVDVSSHRFPSGIVLTGLVAVIYARIARRRRNGHRRHAIDNVLEGAARPVSELRTRRRP